ncbi:hypothetical protein BU14_0113s0004 [Porphyra umbilicalis]|uniref:Uncharacterized protein n=1 Tax=Porphyra umbilicalis TaxID=2786 RepID=A0A1X6PBG2_PORUM|nr:hypothetical protein BU14_0113s0004 [Porphyra umbilicalis]|eukprot:OSX78259.1 hypothetical protein BU14_0113s0004 [Porphyra umbilicalis]
MVVARVTPGAVGWHLRRLHWSRKARVRRNGLRGLPPWPRQWRYRRLEQAPGSARRDHAGLLDEGVVAVPSVLYHGGGGGVARWVGAEHAARVWRWLPSPR